MKLTNPATLRQENIESYIRLVDKNIFNIKKLVSGRQLTKDDKDEIKGFVFSSVDLLRSSLNYGFADIIDRFLRPNLDPARDQNIIEALRKTDFPYYFKNNSELTVNKIINRLNRVNRKSVSIIENLQQYKDPRKTIYKLCSLSNKLKHDNSIEEVVEESSFSIVPNSVALGAGILIEGAVDVEIHDNLIIGGEIQLAKTRSSRVFNNVVGNIRGVNAKNNVFVNNTISGIKTGTITDEHLRFDYNNNIVERHTNTDISLLLEDALVLLKKFAADIRTL